jgi:hypothetical protein
VGRNISLTLQPHPAPYTVGTGSLPGVKRPARCVHHPPLYSAEVKERVELYLYSPSDPAWQVIKFTFIIIIVIVSILFFFFFLYFYFVILM